MDVLAGLGPKAPRKHQDKPWLKQMRLNAAVVRDAGLVQPRNEAAAAVGGLPHFEPADIDQWCVTLRRIYSVSRKKIQESKASEPAEQAPRPLAMLLRAAKAVHESVVESDKAKEATRVFKNVLGERKDRLRAEEERARLSLEQKVVVVERLVKELEVLNARSPMTVKVDSMMSDIDKMLKKLKALQEQFKRDMANAQDLTMDYSHNMDEVKRLVRHLGLEFNEVRGTLALAVGTVLQRSSEVQARRSVRQGSIQPEFTPAACSNPLEFTPASPKLSVVLRKAKVCFALSRQRSGPRSGGSQMNLESPPSSPRAAFGSSSPRYSSLSSRSFFHATSRRSQALSINDDRGTPQARSRSVSPVPTEGAADEADPRAAAARWKKMIRMAQIVSRLEGHLLDSLDEVGTQLTELSTIAEANGQDDPFWQEKRLIEDIYREGGEEATVVAQAVEQGTDPEEALRRFRLEKQASGAFTKYGLFDKRTCSTLSLSEEPPLPGAPPDVSLPLARPPPPGRPSTSWQQRRRLITSPRSHNSSQCSSARRRPASPRAANPGLRDAKTIEEIMVDRKQRGLRKRCFVPGNENLWTKYAGGVDPEFGSTDLRPCEEDLCALDLWEGDAA